MDTIGEKLKYARMEKGLTIGDLQKITKIQRRFLEALEADDFDALPSDYYTRTFIRQFAEAVEINPKLLLRQFDGEPNQKIGYTMPEPVNGSRKERHEVTQKKMFLFRSYVPVLLLILVVSLIIAGVIYAIAMERQSKPMITPPDSVETLTSEQETTTIKEDSSEEEQTESQETEESKEKEDKKLNVTLQKELSGYSDFNITHAEQPITLRFEGITGNCWIGVSEIDKTSFFYQSTLAPGESVEAAIPKDLSSVQVTIGAPPHVKMFINDQPFDFNPNQTSSQRRVLVLNFKDE